MVGNLAILKAEVRQNLGTVVTLGSDGKFINLTGSNIVGLICQHPSDFAAKEEWNAQTPSLSLPGGRAIWMARPLELLLSGNIFNSGDNGHYRAVSRDYSSIARR